MKAFLRRTAQILDIREAEVPEVLKNSPLKTLRVNHLKFEPGTTTAEADNIVLKELAKAEVDAHPVPWYGDAYTFNVEDTSKVQSLALTQEGKIFIQNPSSYLPVLALEPTDDARILDMCSAPGGKASMIAILAGTSSNLVLNEPKGWRLRKLNEVVEMLGLTDATISSFDGRHLPNLLVPQKFGRVLVDAECSTEAGMNFASKNPLKGWSLQMVKRLSVLQKQLITAGYDLLEPGGILVYSTCTLSPEENEGVITSLLQRREGAIIQPLKFNAEKNIRKIKTWEGIKYPAEVSSGVLRIYPSDHMEGFFVARIRKSTNEPRTDRTFTNPVDLKEIASRYCDINRAAILN